MEDEDSQVVMKLYWDCQELQAKLSEATGNARKEAIISSIQEISGKYSKIPDFKPEYSWYNVKSSVSLENLSGMVSVLDFFTYCCINCMHILPDLAALEDKYPRNLAVVGVHSAKFENERAEDQVDHAVRRYGIEHPVCSDPQAWMWSTLGVTCWPTLLILSPAGRPIHVMMGEGHGEFLQEFAGVALEYFGGLGELTGGSLEVEVSGRVQGGVLRYPGKVCHAGEMLVISDSGNNRVLITDLDGTVKFEVGSGIPGDEDGDFAEASFRNPQGVCWVESGSIYVADTDNHLIREIRLSERKVVTVAGTGHQGQDKEGGKVGKSQEISSPWDLCVVAGGDALAVAMAGSHQVWLYCLKELSWWKGAKYSPGTMVRMAGSGQEENRNNSYPAKAGFAQPSGISLDSGFSPNGCLYIADSESSTVRRVDLKDGGVKNVCGGARDPTDLFAYGDVDGAGVNARLQHPLCVAWGHDKLYVADSYNHKIKAVSGPKNDCVTLAGTGKPGNQCGNSGEAQFAEPGGISLSPDKKKLYIADTNNHAIKILDLDDGVVTKLDLKMPELEQKIDENSENTHSIISGGGSLKITTKLEPNKGAKLNSEGPSKWKMASELQGLEFVKEGKVLPGLEWVIKYPPVYKPFRVVITSKLYLCSERDATCFVKNVKHQLVLSPSGDAQASHDFNIGNLF